MSLAASTSLCTECFAEVPCTYDVREDTVWQSKTCTAHGLQEAPVWDGEAHWHWTRSMREGAGAQDACGVEDRKRCLAVITVTDNCNLACSYCFASSKPGLPDRPRDAIEADLQTVLTRSGGPTPIQLSGGEPTTRNDLPELIAHAAAMGFSHIEVNTNGIRLAEEDGYAAALKAAGATTIYLQFDGFGADVYDALRHRKDMEAIKRAAIAACREAALQVILVPTVVLGTNEHQLGDIVSFALDHLDVVRGVNFQPVSHFGRAIEDAGHLSLPRVASLLSAQLGWLKQRDLLQVPCCGPQCSSAMMLLKLPGKVVPLTRLVREEAYKDVVAAFESTKFMDLLAGRKEGVEAAVDAAGCCGIPVPAGLSAFLPRMLAVTVTGFMDKDNVDLERMGQCCINVPFEGELVPFCGYNLTNDKGAYALRPRYAAHAKMRRGGLPVLP